MRLLIRQSTPGRVGLSRTFSGDGLKRYLERCPRTSVNRVSIGASPEVVEVRAGEKKIKLSLILFSNPAALIALIRRHVPADRLTNL